MYTSFKNPRYGAGGICDAWIDREYGQFLLHRTHSYLGLQDKLYGEDIPELH